MFICRTNRTNKINRTNINLKMDSFRIKDNNITLVDQVEDWLLNFFKKKKLRVGDPIPNEKELYTALGVGRSVLREALSRLKMMGMIETRTRRGMVLSEPSLLGGMKKVVDPRILSEDALFDILGFRIALEVGIVGDIFKNITDNDIRELEQIIEIGGVTENNEYAIFSEFSFHAKLYQITGNKTISEFQHIVKPVLTFVKEHFHAKLAPINTRLKKEGRIVTHKNLIEHLRNRDIDAYRKAIEGHFAVYKIFMSEKHQAELKKNNQ